MNVSVRNPTGTPAADDKGSLEGRYVECNPVPMTQIHEPHQEILGYKKWKGRNLYIQSGFNIL